MNTIIMKILATIGAAVVLMILGSITWTIAEILAAWAERKKKRKE